ncbi:uncharacterized protein LOC144617055 isoform X2 [Panthera onca]
MGRGNPNKVFDLNLTSESRDHRDFPQTISLNESVNSKLRGKSWDAISPKTLPGRLMSKIKMKKGTCRISFIHQSQTTILLKWIIVFKD